VIRGRGGAPIPDSWRSSGPQQSLGLNGWMDWAKESRPVFGIDLQNQVLVLLAIVAYVLGGPKYVLFLAVAFYVGMTYFPNGFTQNFGRR